MGTEIIGVGTATPRHVATNHDLAQVMDTSHDWIVKRTGVEQRHYVAPGQGSSDLAIEACQAALRDADVLVDEVDLLVTATMTPDEFAPGIAPTVQHGLGLGTVAAYDVRQQCSGFLYGLDLADAALSTGRASTVLVVGAEAHAGYLPFGDSWAILRGETDGPVKPDDYAAATAARGYAVLFGDGAGAFVLRSTSDAPGVRASSLHTDGAYADLIRVRAAGFKSQPWLDAAQIEAGLHHPTFSGLELFRQASIRMPESLDLAAKSAGILVGDIDVVVAHQANERILDAVRKSMGVDTTVLPSNIDRYGNTTAATIPLMFADLWADDRIKPGSVVGFTAFGAGAHWGSIIYRHA